MGDVSNQDNTIEEVTPKCMDVITEKRDSKRGRSDTVKINKSSCPTELEFFQNSIAVCSTDKFLTRNTKNNDIEGADYVREADGSGYCAEFRDHLVLILIRIPRSFV